MAKSPEPITIIESITAMQAHVTLALKHVEDKEAKCLLGKALERGEVCKKEFRELCHNRFIKGTNGRMNL